MQLSNSPTLKSLLVLKKKPDYNNKISILKKLRIVQSIY